MPDQNKILFICSRNKIRSLTAEYLFKKNQKFQVTSRGTSKGARIKVTAGDVGWADTIFCMEKARSEYLKKNFKPYLNGKQIHTLFVKDIYKLNQPELKDLLINKLTSFDIHID